VKLLSIIFLVIVAALGVISCGSGEATVDTDAARDALLSKTAGIYANKLAEMVETRTLASIEDSERKEIYAAFHAGNMSMIKESFAMEIEDQEMLAFSQEQLLNKNKFEVATKFQLTSKQIDMLIVIGNKYGWKKTVG
jgi:hypothetical protein